MSDERVMTRERGFWFDTRVVDGFPGVKWKAKFIYMMLCSDAALDEQSTVEGVAKTTLFSETLTKRYLKSLVDAGLVVEHKGDAGNADYYTLVEPGPNAQPKKATKKRG